MGKLNERDRAPYRRSWTQEEIGELIRLARQDMTAAEIAFELGLPEYSVSAKLYRLRKAGQLPKVGRGRRKRITTEDEDIAALMARFSAACAVIRKACGQDGSASGKEGKSGE